jgi:hypothetical protein
MQLDKVWGCIDSYYWQNKAFQIANNNRLVKTLSVTKQLDYILYSVDRTKHNFRLADVMKTSM